MKKILKRLEEVGYLSWIEEFIKPRQSRGTLKDPKHYATSGNTFEESNHELSLDSETEDNANKIYEFQLKFFKNLQKEIGKSKRNCYPKVSSKSRRKRDGHTTTNQ